MNERIDSFKPGIYKHYKHTEANPRYYNVMGVARNTETEELYALYIPLYVIPEHKGVRYQVRPLKMFLETVKWNGSEVPRFEYIGQQIK